MVEIGECSTAKPSEEIWATLATSDNNHSVIELRSNVVVICSEMASASQDKHEWCKIVRNPDYCSATIKNLSSESIMVDGAIVRKEDVPIVIKSGSEVISGPTSEGYLSYKFEVMPTEEGCRQQLKVCLEAEHVKCSICLNVWHDVVTVAPCLHNFCNGCFSEWLRRSQEKQRSVLCPHCRAVVQSVGRNHFLHTIVEDILKSDVSLKRSDEEIDLLNSYASIKSNLVLSSSKKQRKRGRSFNGQTDDTESLCPQCGSVFGGFHCNRRTVHIQCQACGGLMPSRADIPLPQHCLGCDRAFCGAYWHGQGVTGNNSHPLCSRETLKPIKERNIIRLPFSLHDGNRHEQDITERCIRQMGRTMQDVVSEWIAKLNNREIDRTRMPLKHAEIITSATHVCCDCYDKLVSFLLYWFRIGMPNHLLPPDAAKREDCWYGYACRTQHHNEEHALKRNHVCRPTRGSNM